MNADARRRTRRRLLVAGLPLALVALAVQWKVAVMLVHDRDGRSDYAAGLYGDAQDAFASNRSLNLVEAWISPYDDGTARYRLADFSGAVRLLEDALAAVPSEEECRVRINLALAHEALGDEAAAGGDAKNGIKEWQDGLVALQEGGCLVLSDGSENSLGSTSLAQVHEARAVDDRLREKLRSDDSLAAAVDAASRARAERLAERNDHAERDRRKLERKKQDQSDAAPNDSTGSGGDDGEGPNYEW